MSLSKTSVNFAQKRGMDLTQELNYDESSDQVEESEVWVWESENDCEPLFILTKGNKDEYFFKGNIYLPEEIKVEIPYWIKNQTHLRQVVDFVSKELKLS